MSYGTPDIDMESTERYICVNDCLNGCILLFVFVYLSKATIPILQVSGEMYVLCLFLFEMYFCLCLFFMLWISVYVFFFL